VTVNGTPRISLIVPAKPEYVIVCRLALDGLAEAAPFLGPETIADLKLAVTEACANSISHAFENGEPGTIRVVVSLSDDDVRVEVVDDGLGMEEQEIADFSPDELRESGMGLALIRALVDELEIGAGEEGLGTRLVFSKRLKETGDE
jgi:serine/threonine-protein kinase RsbW